MCRLRIGGKRPLKHSRKVSEILTKKTSYRAHYYILSEFVSPLCVYTGLRYDDSVVALYANLGNAYSRSPDDTDRSMAVEWLTRGLAASRARGHGEDPVLLNNLGNVELGRGALRDAEGWLLQALAQVAGTGSVLEGTVEANLVRLQRLQAAEKGGE